MVKKTKEFFFTNGIQPRTAMQQNLRQTKQKYKMTKEERNLHYVFEKIQGDHKTRHSNRPPGVEKLN